MKKIFCAAILVLVAVSLRAQFQVVVLKNNAILARYLAGDFIQYSTSDKKHFKYDQIVEMSDSTIIVRNDTIPYHHIRLIDVRAKQGGGITLRRIGSFMIVASMLLPIADLVNVTLIQHDPYSFSEGVSLTSGGLLATSTIILLAKKSYIKIKRKYHLRIADKDSPLYKAQRIIKPSPFLNTLEH